MRLCRDYSRFIGTLFKLSYAIDYKYLEAIILLIHGRQKYVKVAILYLDVFLGALESYLLEIV